MIRFVILFLSSFFLVGCGFLSGTVQQHLVLNIQASSNINTNSEGIPSPLELRVYQLTDSKAFTDADFIQIYSDGQGQLKEELIFIREIRSIFPGEQRIEEIPVAAGMKFVGFIAGFSDYAESKNKVIFEPEVGKSSIVNIEIDGINMSVSVSSQG